MWLPQDDSCQVAINVNIASVIIGSQYFCIVACQTSRNRLKWKRTVDGEGDRTLAGRFHLYILLQATRLHRKPTLAEHNSPDRRF
jgi:hypothetical protein